MGRIHHITLQVDDIGPIVDGYRQQHDCKVDYEDTSWALIRFENVCLALVKAGQHPTHGGISRPDAGRFGELGTHRNGSAAIYIHDPGGNALEIIDSASLKEHA